MLPEVGDPPQVVGQEAVEHRDGLVEVLQHPHLCHVSRVMIPAATTGKSLSMLCMAVARAAARPSVRHWRDEPQNHGTTESARYSRWNRGITP